MDGAVQGYLPFAPYLSSDGDAMVPIVYIAYALGMTADQIQWDTATKTVTLFLTNGDIIQVTVDSTTANKNGVTFTMQDAYNNPVSAVMLLDANGNGTVFIPLSAVAIIFNNVANFNYYNGLITVSAMYTPSPAFAPLSPTLTTVFTIGSAYYSVNGLTAQMPVAPYFSGNDFMIPVRYVAHALGMTDDQIQWDAATGTVTLFPPNGDIMQITVGTPTANKNGVPFTLTDASGNPISTEIVLEANGNCTVFLPLRALANMFSDVSIMSYNSDTITVSSF